jgi:hypothetical protein
MTKPTITIRKATLDDIEQLTEFRISQFKTAKEFRVVDTKPFSEFKGTVLVAEMENEIISTMQYQKLCNFQELILNETFQIPKEFDGFETFHLSKGATVKKYRNTGINSYLRLLILHVAIANDSIKSLTGSAYGSAPRMNVLKRIGYNIVDTQDLDFRYLEPIDNPVFVWLDRVNFVTAIELLETEIEDLKNNYKIIKKIVC